MRTCAPGVLAGVLLELELLDELPHPASATTASAVSAGARTPAGRLRMRLGAVDVSMRTSGVGVIATKDAAPPGNLPPGPAGALAQP